MKRIAAIILVSLVGLALVAMANISTSKREASFKVTPNLNLNANRIRVNNGELLFNRTATFNVELYNAENRIVDRTVVVLSRAELRQWFSSTNPVSTIKGLIAGKLTVVADDTEVLNETE